MMLSLEGLQAWITALCGFCGFGGEPAQATALPSLQDFAWEPKAGSRVFDVDKLLGVQMIR